MTDAYYGGPRTLGMKVANIGFMLDRLGQDCAPTQFLRELTQNSIEAIAALDKPEGEIVWDYDANQFALTGNRKLSIIDTGIGMTGEEMVEYINQLSSSAHEQSHGGNFGVGAKIAAATRNPAGLIYLSWKEGVGSMIHLWRDPESGEYGLRQFLRPDGTFGHWGHIEDTVKPQPIKDHGTMVVLLGHHEDDNTVLPPEGTSSAATGAWIARYINTRYFEFPHGVTVKVRSGWEEAKDRSLRKVNGQRHYLDSASELKGSIPLKNAVAHWWILADEKAITSESGRYASTGHMAALFQSELYEMQTGRAGVARLQHFGVIFGYQRVVIYVEPSASGAEDVKANTARTSLLFHNESLPWADWASEFRDKMPQPIQDLMAEVTAASVTGDHRQAIRERLRQIRDLLRLSRYRPTPTGEARVESEIGAPGGRSNSGEDDPERQGEGRSGGSGGRAGNIYALFLKDDGAPASETSGSPEPDVRWVTIKNKSRAQGDLEDRAAKYLADQNMLLINADFRVFTDMVRRWHENYPGVPGAQDAIEEIVREWFEQQLVETVLGAQALRGGPVWTVDDLKRLLSEEALTAAVLPRYHVDLAIKRAVGSKLGSVKEKVATSS